MNILIKDTTLKKIFSNAVVELVTSEVNIQITKVQRNNNKISNNANPNYATTTTTTTTTRTTTTEKHQKTRTKQTSSPVVECNAQAPAGPPDSQKGGRPLQIPEVLSCLFLGLTLLKKSTRPSYYKSVIVFFNRNTPCS